MKNDYKLALIIYLLLILVKIKRRCYKSSEMCK